MKYWFVFFIQMVSAAAAYADCTSPSGVEGQFQYITTEYKWCDGTNWQSMTVAATGSPCSVAGTMWYNANDILFCNGSNWVSMNGSATNGSCSGSTLGTVRYNSSPKKMEWCDGTNWKFMTAGGAPAATGYFVVTAGWYDGNLGGLSGANATCLTDLTNNPWLGKSGATLDAAHVRAFLCDATTCNNVLPNTTYTFASGQFPTNGGATFTSNASGAGPNDSADWSDSGHFGLTVKTWEGRDLGANTAWGTIPGSATCSSWSTNANGTKAWTGQMGSTDYTRWYSTQDACSNTRSLICIVDPGGPDTTPDAFSFTDQTGLTASTLTLSNILQITGIAAAATVSISGGEFRVCADNTCSANPAWGSANSTISNNQYLQLRATSSAFSGTVVNVTVTVGGVSDTWSLTTAGAAITGYFVMSAGTWNGNLGDVSGANAKCVTDLTANDWKGKSSAGTLDSTTVKAFLCNTASCNQLLGFTTYAFARSGSTTSGGATFTTAAGGLGPNDSNAWTGPTYFDVASATWWTGRDTNGPTQWSPNPATITCSDWTVGGGGTYGYFGDITYTDDYRWTPPTTAACTGSRRLICYVNPNGPDVTPNSFTFTDSWNNSTSTLVTSEIVQITGLGAAATVSVNGSGSPQFRICSSSNCTAGTVITDWQSSASTISNNQYLQVRGTTAPAISTFYSIEVRVGTEYDTWKIGTGSRPGYFVWTFAGFPNYGGRAGADAICLSNLQANQWKGKGDITLDSSTVKAFLCDSSGCFNLNPNTEYFFAATDDPLSGGASFITDGAGLGPNNSDAWSDSTHFNTTIDWWYTGRDVGSATKWSANGSGRYCSDWTSSSSSVNGTYGDSVGVGAARWSVASTCGGSGSLICVVSPPAPDTTPDAFSFTDQTGAATSTLLTSNILQITGITVPASVTVTGTGSPEFRICSSSDCSTGAGAWGSTGTTIANNQYLQLRLTSHSLAGRTNGATISVGTATDTWTVKTAGDATNGYFVLSQSTWAGTLGGRSGANSACLTELTNTDWNGKLDAAVDAAHVFAFLCDSTACNNLAASTTYVFARAGDVSSGGASFTTNASAVGPGDSSAWSGATYFNTSVTYYSGRGAGTATLWGSAPGSNTCQNWTTSASNRSGMYGDTSGTAATRWASTFTSCNNALKMVCYVNPGDTTPNAFSFTDQTNVALSTLTTSNIVQITGIDTATAVSISGGGSPQFRVCADATCSTNPAWGSSSATITNNQYLQLRLTSSSSTNTTLNATVTVGAGSDTWSVTTSSTATQAFSYTGSNQSFVVPAGVNSLTVKLWGAGGGAALSNAGGGGGFATGTLSVTPGETLTIVVGQGGMYGSNVDWASASYGGGGASGGVTGWSAGGGGGRSAIRRSTTELITAGGGGGGGAVTGTGGPAGGTSGGAGSDSVPNTGGGGGTQAAGGTAGSNGAQAGSSLTGGQGGTDGTWPGGGGGGGYFGGGGGGSGSGGGGGSSYTGGVTGGSTTAASGASAANSGDSNYAAGIAAGGSSTAGGNGRVVISW